MEVEFNRHSHAFPPPVCEANEKMSGYSQTKSHLSEEALIDFLKLSWSAPLESVPGIGDASNRRLKAKGLHTLLQLAGIFLTFRSPGVSHDEWLNKTWQYLASLDVPKAHCHSIVHALDEKLTIAFPELRAAEPEAGAVGVDSEGQLVARAPHVLTLKVHLSAGSYMEFRHVEGSGTLTEPVPLDPKLRDAVLVQCEAIVDDPKAADRVNPVIKGLFAGHGFDVTAVSPSLSKSDSSGGGGAATDEDEDALSLDRDGL